MPEGGLVCQCMWECTLGVQFFKLVETDQSEMTKSHLLNTSLKLINHIYLMAKEPPRVKCH